MVNEQVGEGVLPNRLMPKQFSKKLLVCRIINCILTVIGGYVPGVTDQLFLKKEVNMRFSLSNRLRATFTLEFGGQNGLNQDPGNPAQQTPEMVNEQVGGGILTSRLMPKQFSKKLLVCRIINAFDHNYRRPYYLPGTV